jgi:integrase
MVTAGMSTGRDQSKKKGFRCKKCHQITMESCSLHKSVNLLRKFSPNSTKPFNFDDDNWDTRGLIELDDSTKSYGLNFSQVKIDFLKLLSKRYVLHCLRTGVSLNTLAQFVRVCSRFSDYLGMNYNITSMEELTREMVLGFMAEYSPNFSSETIRHYLSSLRGFFDTGNLLGWFNVSEHLIRTEDYPKAKRGTPHDIPTVVLSQIEENLHKLPDTIARMWLVGFFCAMRISELQLCKWDCLKQDSRGQWFIEFWRKKNKDTHRLPITLERAKIIQEQQEYIQQRFGDSFDYLFCDFYQAFKTADPLKVYNQPIPKPVRSIVLSESINALIKAEDIRDENGLLWKFTNHQLRDTNLTYLFETGHEMAVISKWAGHRHLRTTQKYVRVKDKTLREETFKIQAKMVNFRGEPVEMKTLPNTLQENPHAHTLAYDDQINMPIYGYCGLSLDQDCPHWKACYTCPSFVARRELLPDYIRVRDLLREKQARAAQKGQTAMVDQFKQQADSLDAIITSFEEKSA